MTSSFTVSVTNNSGFALSPSSNHFSFPGYSISTLSAIPDNSTQVLEITLDNPKDPCSFFCVFSIPSHPFKIILNLYNPLGSEVDQLKLTASYLEKTWGFKEVTIGSLSGCAADALGITIPSLTLVTVIS
jgi:hypothetical protein